MGSPRNARNSSGSRPAMRNESKNFLRTLAPRRTTLRRSDGGGPLRSAKVPLQDQRAPERRDDAATRQERPERQVLAEAPAARDEEDRSHDASEHDPDERGQEPSACTQRRTDQPRQLDVASAEARASEHHVADPRDEEEHASGHEAARHDRVGLAQDAPYHRPNRIR